MKAARKLFTEFRTGQGLKGQLLRGGVGSVAVRIGSTLLSVALAVVLARALGAEGFGVYSFVFALITILAIPAQMGLPNLVVRETAKAQAANDWALINGLWRWSTLMALMMSAVLIVIGALAAWIFAARLPEGGLAVFYWGLVLVPLIALGNLRGAALRGLRHVVQGQLPEFILRPAFLVILVLGAYFGLSARALTASDAMMLHAFASLAAFIIGAWLLLNKRPKELIAQKEKKSEVGAWLASALPLGMIAGMQVVNQNIGSLALGIFDSYTEVALFKISSQVAAVVSTPITIINIAIAPYLSRLFYSGQREGLIELVNMSIIISGSLSILIFIILTIFGRFIISSFFGAGFSGSYVPLLVLSFGNVLISLMGPLLTLASMTGNEALAMRSMALGTVIIIPALIVLVINYSSAGAALAVVFSMVIWRVSLTARLERQVGFRIDPLKIRSF